MRRMYCVLAVGLVVSAGAGCQRQAPRDERQVDLGLVRLDAARMRLRHDRVGHGKWASEASFVLVDAENIHGQDLMVTVAGELVDGQGTPVGRLRPASLRIPAGGLRTFALVDEAQAVRARAVSARVRVVGAQEPGYASPVQVSEGHAFPDGDRVVVTARVHNTADRPVRVLVLGGFHDRRGVPVQRPFTEMYLPGGASHTAQFVGPPGSAKGYIFIGDLVY